MNDAAATASQLSDNDFVLFQLPQQFSLDLAGIDSAWKQLQSLHHPDNFVQDTPAAQRQAMQWSVRINQARQRLMHPVQRAAYLCELQGQAIAAHDNTHMPPDFLMQQIEWRDDWDELRTDASALEDLAKKISTLRQTQIDNLATLIDVERNYAAAAQEVRKILFIDKFLVDIHADIDRLLGV